MQITWVVVLIGLSILLFEIFPEKSAWSIPVRQVDEHTIVVPSSEGFSLLLMHKQDAYKTLTKEQERFWKRILIVDDNVDITVTFKTAIEDNNNTTLTKKLRYIRLTILSWHCQNSKQISMIFFWLILTCHT